MQAVGIAYLSLRQEAAAVDEAETVDIAGKLGGLGTDQGNEGILLMAGGAPLGFDTVGALTQRRSYQTAFPGPGAP